MFEPGQDVTVEFCGRDHVGEVLRHSGSWVMCRILIDPAWDYGSVGARLDPQPIVCVPAKRVRPPS